MQDKIKTDRFEVYYSGLILFTFGRIDVVSSIISNRVSFPDPRWTYIGCFQEMLPLPATLDINASVQAVMQWVEEHQNQLQWNEAEGRFYRIQPSHP